jgi:hypothetical protein
MTKRNMVIYFKVVTQDKKEKYNKTCDYLENLGRISLYDKKMIKQL